MSAEPLKPCPFCGFSTAFCPEVEHPDEDFQWVVRCATCGCEVRGFQDEKAARAGWDSRDQRAQPIDSAAIGKLGDILLKVKSRHVDHGYTDDISDFNEAITLLSALEATK